MKNKKIKEMIQNRIKDIYQSCEYIYQAKELEEILSYIEQLEKENKKYKDLGFEHLCKRNEQLENNRDKAIEYMKNNSKISLDDSVSIIRFYKQLKIILEGDRNE